MDNWLDGSNGRYPAIVVYSDGADFRILRLLRRGFRHCFVMLPVGRFWVVVDPLCNRTGLSVTDLPGLCEHLIALHHQKRRCQVVWAMPSPSPSLTLRPFTCVEAVKRHLGIVAAFVLTPYQLYLHNNKNILTTNERGRKEGSAGIIASGENLLGNIGEFPSNRLPNGKRTKGE